MTKGDPIEKDRLVAERQPSNFHSEPYDDYLMLRILPKVLAAFRPLLGKLRSGPGRGLEKENLENWLGEGEKVLWSQGANVSQESFALPKTLQTFVALVQPPFSTSQQAFCSLGTRRSPPRERSRPLGRSAYFWVLKITVREIPDKSL